MDEPTSFFDPEYWRQADRPKTPCCADNLQQVREKTLKIKIPSLFIYYAGPADKTQQMRH